MACHLLPPAVQSTEKHEHAVNAAPVLDYHRPLPGEATINSVLRGIISIWVSLGVTLLFTIASSGQAFLPVFMLAALTCLMLAIDDYCQRKNLGIALGLVVGLVSVAGVGSALAAWLLN